MNTDVKELHNVQSYLSSVVKGRFSALELRYFMAIVRHAQGEFTGIRYKELIRKSIKTDGIAEQFSVRADELLGEGGRNYGGLRAAAESLVKKQVSYYDSSTGDWKVAALLSAAEYNSKKGIITLTCQRWVIDLIADFSKGFSAYNYTLAMRLSQGPAMRLYMLMAHQDTPVTLSLRYLRELLGAEKKYSLNADFLRRCIDGPSKELARKGCNGFTWEPVKRGKEIQAVKFTPVKRETPDVDSLTARASLSAFVNPAMERYLLQNCAFTTKELSGNKATLFEFGKLPDWPEALVRISEYASIKGRKKGYIIGAMKKEIKKFNDGGRADG